MEVPLDIHADLPLAQEDGPAWILSAAQVNFMVRKIEAFSNIQADAPLRIVKSDSGFKIVVEE